MKIAICSTFLGQKTSGGEISAYHLASNLRKNGEDAFIVTAKIDGKLPVRGYAVPAVSTVPNLLLLIGCGQIDRLIERKVYEVFRKEKPDIIHIQDSSILIPSVRAAKRLGIPAVMTVRDYRFSCNLTGCLEDGKVVHSCSKKAYRRCLRKMFQDVYRIGFLAPLFFPWFYRRNLALISGFRSVGNYIAVSAFVREQMICSGVRKEDVSTILVQKEDWRPIPSPGKPVIFTAGGLKLTKGFDFLISSFRKVSDDMPDAVLRIAGDGSARARLESQVRTLGLERKVVFLGAISRKKMMEEYRRCLFVVSPSLWPEPLSRILFESYSMGRAVVATDVGGTGELVKHGKTGLLVEPGDEKGFAASMLRMLADDLFREKCGKQGRMLILRCCSPKVNYAAHRKVYMKVKKAHLSVVS